MMKVNNDAGIFNAKVGYYNGKKVTVTHRDPASNQVYLEDYPVNDSKPILYGLWVSNDSVKYC